MPSPCWPPCWWAGGCPITWGGGPEIPKTGPNRLWFEIEVDADPDDRLADLVDPDGNEIVIRN